MRTRLTFSFYLLTTLAALSQPIEVWVARYNGGFTNRGHIPLALKLDSTGNVFVAGSSQNASNVFDYVVLKYAPNGTQLCTTRYSSTNGANFTMKGFAVAQDGSALLTGTGGTVNLDANGKVVWTAPYPGQDVAVDTNGNVYVTGFSWVQYATAKLDAAGSNIWVRTYEHLFGPPGEWPTVSEKVAVDNLGRVYVAGSETYFVQPCHSGTTNLCQYTRPSMLAYDSAGTCLWTNISSTWVWRETKGLIPDNQGNVYVTGNMPGYVSYYVTEKIDASGQMKWLWSSGPPGVTEMALDTNGNVYLTGSGSIRFSDDTVFVTFKVGPTGQKVWQTNYFGPVLGVHFAEGVALDNSGNVFVTGVSTNSGTFNDFATIKYDSDGHELWVKRYNGPANGNDGATSIAVAPDGSIYVTGYSANDSGGSDITTIKYVQPTTTIHRQPDGSILLQGCGLPSSNYIVHAGTNLLDWLELGSSVADTNGRFQFTDTNTPSFPFRFYRWFGP